MDSIVKKEIEVDVLKEIEELQGVNADLRKEIYDLGDYVDSELVELRHANGKTHVVFGIILFWACFLTLLNLCILLCLAW